MSIDSLTKRVARLEGGADAFDRYLARLSDDEVDAICDARDKYLAGCTRAEWMAALGPTLLVKAETLFRLTGEEPKYAADPPKEP